MAALPRPAQPRAQSLNCGSFSGKMSVGFTGCWVIGSETMPLSRRRTRSWPVPDVEGKPKKTRENFRRWVSESQSNGYPYEHCPPRHAARASRSQSAITALLPTSRVSGTARWTLHIKAMDRRANQNEPWQAVPGFAHPDWCVRRLRCQLH